MAIGVVGWEASRDEWLEARRKGVGGSDISAILGYSIYRSPWDVWSEKAKVKTWEDGNSDAAQLGVALEPWLREQAGTIVGEPAAETQYRTYCHSEDFSERMCSPDGVFADGRLLECKTAGLASGWGAPRGWEGGELPLGYEFQCRWSMHVMDAPAVEVVALVAGMGLQHRTVTRELATELELVSQVGTWWNRYVMHDEEPPLGARDAEVMQQLYPRCEVDEVDLSHTNALEHWSAYKAAQRKERIAEEWKKEAGANLKNLIGKAGRGMVDGQCIATWGERRGRTEWRVLVEDLVNELMAKHDIPILDVDQFIESRVDKHTGPSTRTLSVKDLTND